MTTDTKPNIAHDSSTHPLRKVRRRLGWALGSALGVLLMSITSTVVVLESRSSNTLPGTSRVPGQGAYPAGSISGPSDGQVGTLQSRVPSEPDTAKSTSAVLRRS